MSVTINPQSPDIATITIDEAQQVVLNSNPIVFLTGDDANTLGGQAPAYYRDRANHTGTQSSTTVTYTAPFTGAQQRTQADKNAESLSALDFGLIADNALHTVAEWIPSRYANLAAIQSDFPHVTEATNDLNWAVLQQCLNIAVQYGKNIKLPVGLIRYAKGVSASLLTSSFEMIQIVGSGKHLTRLLYTNTVTTEPAFYFDLKKSNGKAGSIVFSGIGLSKVGISGGDGIKLLNSARSHLDSLYIYGFVGGCGISFDVSDNVGSDFNKVSNVYCGANNIGIKLDVTSTTASYLDANKLIDCDLVNNEYADVIFANSGGQSGRGNANYISDMWMQVKTGSLGLSIQDDVYSCKINNLAIDGELSTDNVVNIASGCGYNLFTNISIDGSINDLSAKAEFFNLAESTTAKKDRRSILDNIGFRPRTVNPPNLLNGMLWYRSDLQKLQCYSGATVYSIPQVINTTFAAIDPNSLLDGEGQSIVFTVAGAELGDCVLAAFETDVTGITVTAYVRQTNSVVVRLQNETGFTLNLPSTTVNIKVFKK